MTRTKLSTSTTGKIELNHGVEQLRKRRKAKLTNIVIQQRTGAELNNTIPARRQAKVNSAELQTKLNITERQQGEKTELNNNIFVRKRAEMMGVLVGEFMLSIGMLGG